MAITINRKALLIELAKSEFKLKGVAMELLTEQAFAPAVAALKYQFESHPVTRELRGGIDASNISATLDAPFNDPPDRQHDRHLRADYSPPNLTSFIGLEDPEAALKEIEVRLDPSHQDGPKLRYQGMDKDRLAFRFQILAPDFDAIQAHTPLPWAPGISWARRIEVGLSGIGHFLNAIGKRGSRSGGGIQVDADLRSGRFKPTKYLSNLFDSFLKRVSTGVRS